MENHSHSRPPNKVSKRGTSNGGKFAATSMYDDVFGGPPSFGVPNLSPRPEDYYEIFGGFHASRPTSIPILDLPLGDEEEVECDVRDGDYGEVFGGVGGLDFASSVEELLMQSSSGGGRGLVGGVNGDDSSDGAWTPTETESQSGDSDHFRKNQCSSSGDFYEPIGSSTEFSISYHKVDRRNGDLFNGVTHIAQLDVPDYAWLVDESRLGKKAGNMKPPIYAHDDCNLDLAGNKLQGKHLRRTMSHSTKSAAGLNTFTYELDSDGSHGNVGPSSDEAFVTISEISLKTQPSEVPPPSRPPPVLDGKRKKHENCQTTASEGIFGSSSQSPPYFDVEIDAGLKSDAENKKENLSKAVDVSRNVADERVQGTGREEDSAMEPSIKQEKQVRKAKSEVQLVVKHKEEQQLEKDSKHMENQKRYKECQETKDDEKRQSKLFECDENDVKLGQVHEQAENEKTTEGAREQEDDTDNSLTQYSEPEESEKKEEEADELDEGEMIWRMALEQLENEKKLNQALELEERWKKGGQACSKEGNEKRSERVLEQENNKKKQVYEREAVEKKVEQDRYAKDTIGKPMEEAFELEDNSIKEALDGEDEMKLKHTQEQEENENLKGINGVQNKFVPEQEEGKNKIVQPPLEQESAETRRKIDAAQSSLGEAQGNTLKTAQPVKPGQSTEKKDKNVGKNLAANEKAKRKIEMENEHLRKKEEKDWEREKDRMADDKVTLEARERAFAGAHERARKCFVEDAMAEGAAFGKIERLERSVSDIFSSFSRDTRVGISSSSSDLQSQQFQTTVSFNCPRYSLDNNGVEGEPAQRCKARLERYRRTAERAAKALAEKNMRDLLAQKEQTERNRVADTLDAEFRRWSSGKEKNLRALLSTLQYILGPDSCWQPVPLTEVITSAAVKKAYRKATLCVHPDKLQQRGASIQQKYISEKVYYLLQEAWNRFNSEEW